MYNAEMKPKDIKKYCTIRPGAKTLLIDAYKKLNFSARSYFKLIKVAQTIADLDIFEDIQEKHILEALQYRIKEV